MSQQDILLEGTVTDIYPPDRGLSIRLRESIAAIADGKHVVIVADDRHGPDGLLDVFRSMASLRGVGNAPAPPTLVLEDPPFDQGDEIRVHVDETHVENVFLPVDGEDSLECI